MKSRMRGLMRKYVAVISLCLFVAGNAGAGVWTAAGQVTHYYPNGVQAAIYTKTTAAVSNPAACPKTVYYRLELTNPVNKEISALLMAAQVSGRNVILFIDDLTCSSDGYPVIQHATLR